MKRLKLFLLALLVFSTTIFSFGGIAHADDLTGNIAPSPLRQNEPELQQVTQDVTDKKMALGDQTDQISQLEQKKQELAQKLADEQKTIDTLSQQIADKKAAAEAERKRVEELKNMFVHINGYAFDSRGNTYAWGNCTWYAKSRRADASNSWGNANTWYSRAAAQGWKVGQTPKKGAIATSTGGWLGHVAYVEGITPDGQWVTISEMNYAGLNVVSSRIVHYTAFEYIYELN